MCATMANPKANYKLEIINQFIENLVWTFDSLHNYLEDYYPWEGILADSAFVVWSTYHIMLQSMLVKMVFGCDMVLNTPFVATWGAIIKHKNR